MLLETLLAWSSKRSPTCILVILISRPVSALPSVNRLPTGFVPLLAAPCSMTSPWSAWATGKGVSSLSCCSISSTTRLNTTDCCTMSCCAAACWAWACTCWVLATCSDSAFFSSAASASAAFCCSCLADSWAFCCSAEAFEVSPACCACPINAVKLTGAGAGAGAAAAWAVAAALSIGATFCSAALASVVLPSAAPAALSTADSTLLPASKAVLKAAWKASDEANSAILSSCPAISGLAANASATAAIFSPEANALRRSASGLLCWTSAINAVAAATSAVACVNASVTEAPGVSAMAATTFSNTAGFSLTAVKFSPDAKAFNMSACGLASVDCTWAASCSTAAVLVSASDIAALRSVPSAKAVLKVSWNCSATSPEAAAAPPTEDTTSATLAPEASACIISACGEAAAWASACTTVLTNCADACWALSTVAETSAAPSAIEEFIEASKFCVIASACAADKPSVLGAKASIFSETFSPEAIALIRLLDSVTTEDSAALRAVLSTVACAIASVGLLPLASASWNAGVCATVSGNAEIAVSNCAGLDKEFVKAFSADTGTLVLACATAIACELTWACAIAVSTEWPSLKLLTKLVETSAVESDDKVLNASLTCWPLDKVDSNWSWLDTGTCSDACTATFTSWAALASVNASAKGVPCESALSKACANSAASTLPLVVSGRTASKFSPVARAISNSVCLSIFA